VHGDTVPEFTQLDCSILVFVRFHSGTEYRVPFRNSENQFSLIFNHLLANPAHNSCFRHYEYLPACTRHAHNRELAEKLLQQLSPKNQEREKE
jgi:hypothetical protein